MVSIFILLSLVYAVSTNHVNQEVISQSQQQQFASGNEHRLSLPSGSDLVWAPIDSSFSCDEHTFGYFADVLNDCRVYHVCQPGFGPNGTVARHSFFCPSETRFDQKRLACVSLSDANECSESEKLFAETKKRFIATNPPIVFTTEASTMANTVHEPQVREKTPIKLSQVALDIGKRLQVTTTTTTTTPTPTTTTTTTTTPTPTTTTTTTTTPTPTTTITTTIPTIPTTMNIPTMPTTMAIPTLSTTTMATTTIPSSPVTMGTTENVSERSKVDSQEALRSEQVSQVKTIETVGREEGYQIQRQLVLNTGKRAQVLVNSPRGVKESVKTSQPSRVEVATTPVKSQVASPQALGVKRYSSSDVPVIPESGKKIRAHSVNHGFKVVVPITTHKKVLRTRPTIAVPAVRFVSEHVPQILDAKSK